MSKSFVVSVFVGESMDDERSTYIGSRFIPYIYELIKEHEDIVFLLPHGWATTDSVARTVRVVAQNLSAGTVRCRTSVCRRVGDLCEKMVNASDLSLFYIEKDNELIFKALNYAEETGRKFIMMK